MTASIVLGLSTGAVSVDICPRIKAYHLAFSLLVAILKPSDSSDTLVNGWCDWRKLSPDCPTGVYLSNP